MVTDQRVHKVCLTLQKTGYEVLLVGRHQRKSLALDNRSYTTHRMKLLFEKGPAFYAAFNVRLFFYLLFRDCDLLVSNDLDTLLPNYLISKWKHIPLIYDTHEIFTEVPELEHSPIKKRIWTWIETRIVPGLRYVFTVNQSIALWYKDKYGTEPTVVRNIPQKLILTSEKLTAKSEKTALKPAKTRAELGLPEGKQLIILQGAGINIQRGGEELVEAMKYVENTLLLVIGSGDVINVLKVKAMEPDLKGKVMFVGKLPYSEMMEYTRLADIGLTLDKADSLNYRFSLPNKLFDYIQAGTAILASRLTEVERIIRHYDIGEFIDNHNPKHIADKINQMLASGEQLLKWKENTKLAARELTWENEEMELMKVYKLFL